MVDTFNATSQLFSNLSDTDSLNFAMTKFLQHINTLILGKIIDVDTPTKRLIVKSLINGVDSKDLPIDPPQIYDVPYCAQRGGIAGIITEYQIGDTVVIGFCQRQIDITKNTQSQSTPNLTRFHSLMDAVVLSHWSNDEPTIFVKVTNDGIEIQALDKPLTIQTTGDINIQADNVTINGILKVGNTTITTTGISNTGGILVDNVDFLTHTHSGVTTGTDSSGPVNP